MSNLAAQCGQLMSLCTKNPELIPGNITMRSNRLAKEVEALKIHSSTSDVTEASP